MLDGWQGYWTSATFDPSSNTFTWGNPIYQIIDIDELWGFKRLPYKDTCVWVIQFSVYNYTLGNYDCSKTQTGYICEIKLPK